MQQCVEHFLAAVWEQLTAVYQQESKRIMDLKEQSKLQAGVFHYLKVAWKKGKVLMAISLLMSMSHLVGVIVPIG